MSCDCRPSGSSGPLDSQASARWPQLSARSGAQVGDGDRAQPALLHHLGSPSLELVTSVCRSLQPPPSSLPETPGKEAAASLSPWMGPLLPGSCGPASPIFAYPPKEALKFFLRKPTTKSTTPKSRAWNGRARSVCDCPLACVPLHSPSVSWSFHLERSF